jgi:tRNA/tmRNA/rRNA uracil-C5-methylase (TrmA/RlmC/RlmD family)
VRAERLVAGGAALARRDDGRIVLVDGALPGERVEVTVSTRRGVERGAVVRVVAASPQRVEPRCVRVADGCGGCDLMHLAPPAQAPAKVEVVEDALRRLGGWAAPVVRAGPPLDPWAFRTTMRLAVADGRAGLRRAGSHDVVVLDRCAIAHPALDELVHEGRFGDAREVTLRVGAATGERLALVSPSRDGTRLPDDVLVVGADELARGKRAWIHEDVGGRRWRVSATAFFQSRPDGAAALVEVVRALAADVLDRAGGDRPAVLVDAYSGVGLFAGCLLDGRSGWRALCAEEHRSAVADARVNLADLDVKVVATAVERLRAPQADLVVADPARTGLGRRAADALAGADPERIVLVSCDPAAAGRDAALLAARGYAPVEAVVVDLFPHTHHVEAVVRFDRR